MKMTKRALSIVLAAMMIISMFVVGTVSASADVANGTIETVDDLVYAAANGGVYTVSGTIDVSQSIFINSGTNLTLKGTGTITTDQSILFVVNGGTLTLQKGTYTSNYAGDDWAIVVYNYNHGTVNVSGATINALSPEGVGYGVYTNNATTNVTSGKINVNGWGITSYTNANVNVSGGTITVDGYGISANGNPGLGGYVINISGGTIDATELGIYHNNTGTLNITGGTIKGATALYIKSGITNIYGGTITGNGAKNSYQDWQNGGNPTGDAIVLDYDQAYQNGGPVDVNIYAGTVTSTNAQPISDNTRPGNDAIHDTDVILGGKFTSTNDTVDTDVIDALAYGDITYDATKGTVVSDDYDAVIDGVPYAFSDAVEVAAGTKALTMLKKAAPYTMSLGQTIIVNDYNKVQLSAPAGVYALNRAYNSTTKLYTYTVVDAVASLTVDNTTTYYSTISAAADAAPQAPATSTITLLRDSTESSLNVGSATVKKNVVFDLGGNTLTLTRNYASQFVIRCGSNVTVDNGTIIFDTVYYNANGFSVQDGSTLTLGANLDVISTGTTSAVYVQSGTLTTEADMTVEDSYAVSTNGSQTVAGSAININGGNITSATETAVYLPGQATTTITGGNITGATAIFAKSGTLNITGGTFTATGAAAEFTHNGNGCNATGDAIVVENCNYPGGVPNVSITAGTFSSENAEAVASYAQDETYEPKDKFVTGGTFSSDVTDLCDTGLIAVTNGSADNTYHIGNEADYVAKNETTGVGYTTTLGDAITAASNGDTVKLLADANGSFTISAKTLTIDLNGFNIKNSSTTSQPLVANGGAKLTIVNSNADKAENTDTQNAIIGIKNGSAGSLAAYGENTEVEIHAGYYYGFNGNKTAIHAYNGATITFYDCVVNCAATIDAAPAQGKEGKVFYSGLPHPSHPDDNDPGTIIVHGGTFNGRMSDSNWGNYLIDGGTFNRNTVVLNENGFNDDGSRKVYETGSMVSLGDGNFYTAHWLADGYKVVKNANGTYTVVYDDNPLDDDMGTLVSADNAFGISGEFTSGSLLGVQNKAKQSVNAPETSASGQETGEDIRFVAALDTLLVQGADDYGFVLAKVNNTFDNTMDFTKLRKGDDRLRTISCKGTYNNLSGDNYGDPTDSSTDYKFITCGVNGLTDGYKVAARFYVTIGGKTYYAQYAKNTANTGLVVGWDDIINA